MKLDKLMAQWTEDCQIDSSQLDAESLTIPKLHNKYWKILMAERHEYKRLQFKHNQLFKDKQEYYLGKLPQEDLQEYGWKPFQLKLVKSEIPTYLDADSDLIESLLRLALQSEKVDYLKDIIKTINTRNFLIKNAIDFLKFQNGIV